MSKLAQEFWNDDNGFIVSAELVLVGTIVALGMMVGLAKVSHSVNGELYDMADSFDHSNHGGKKKGHYDRLGHSDPEPEMKGY